MLTQPQFIKSAPSVDTLPADIGQEIAFAGRSNVGKSSVLNAIVGLKKLARTSKTPGRTQLLNVFSVAQHSRIVDLPGYGYARVPEAVRKRWGRMIEAYFQRRASLCGLFLIMDIRHPLTAFDQQMLSWVAGGDLAVHVVLNKADKFSRGRGLGVLSSVRHALPDTVTVQTFSALKRHGVDEARDVLEGWLALSDGASQNGGHT